MAGNGYIKSLDGVRAFAILLVMSLHSGVTWFGWIGVQLFFVLSGFLIGGILWRDRAAEGGVGFKLKKFWVRRALRIFPLYFGYLAALTIVYLCVHYPDALKRYLPYLLTYTYNFTRTFTGWKWYPAFTHFWSLCIEEQFYLFFPLFILFCSGRVVRIVMISAVFAAPVIRWGLGQHFMHAGLSGDALMDVVYWHPLSHLDAFFMGALIHVLSLDKRVRRPQWLVVIAFLVAVLAGVAEFLTHGAGRDYLTDLGYRIGESGSYEYVWQYSCLNFVFASVILLLVSDSVRGRYQRLRRLLESRILVSIGRVSYGMYIFHWLVWSFIFKPYADVRGYFFKPLVYLPFVLIVYLVAAVSFRYYESFFIGLKDRFFPRPEIAAKKKADVAQAENSLGV